MITVIAEWFTAYLSIFMHGPDLLVPLRMPYGSDRFVGDITNVLVASSGPVMITQGNLAIPEDDQITKRFVAG